MTPFEELTNPAGLGNRRITCNERFCEYARDRVQSPGCNEKFATRLLPSCLQGYLAHEMLRPPLGSP